MIANMISNTREVEDARRLFKMTKQHAGKPWFIVTDGLPAYERAVRKEFRTLTVPRTEHIRCAGIIKKQHNNKVERLHGIVREREKIMRGMQRNETAKILMSGFRDYYNFIRGHMALNGMTPAEMANINLELGRNRWKNLIKQSVKN